MKKSNKKNIIVIIFIIIAVIVACYLLLISPKKYEEGELSFKLPHGFINKSTNYYVKEFYDNPFAGGTMFCSVRINNESYNQSSYDSNISFLAEYYHGNKSTKQINGKNWDYISGQSNRFLEDIYLLIVDSNYYEVKISNSKENPCSLKDINTIVNSLKIIKN